jgi:hypothetical protein
MEIKSFIQKLVEEGFLFHSKTLSGKDILTTNQYLDSIDYLDPIKEEKQEIHDKKSAERKRKKEERKSEKFQTV